MPFVMQAYLDLLKKIVLDGEDRDDRTGVGVRSVFGAQFRHDMRTGFPLLTTKRLSFKNIAHELLWFLSGDTNIKYLNDNGVTIWDEWADAEGNLGPVYGAQWRMWEAPGQGVIDQISRLVNELRRYPRSRRHIVTAWNPADIESMSLPPCHCMWQCYVSNDNTLSIHVYQRSADVFLGVPYNIASYGLLLTMLAHVLNMKRGELIFSYGDLHLYRNHFEQAVVQINRMPLKLPDVCVYPQAFEERGTIFSILYDSLRLENYKCHPHIKADVAV